MTNLEFKNQLDVGLLSSGRPRRLVGGNMFTYRNIEDSLIRYVPGDAEIPYIMDTRMHSNILQISCNHQWYRSSFTIDMLKSVMDTAHVPIPIRILYQRVYYNYLIGKGFIAKFNNDIHRMDLLFVACKPTCIPNNRLTMKNITFYISKSIKDIPGSKKIRDIIEDFADNHVGDVVHTNDIDKYIGHNIKYPTFSTIPQKKEYISKLIDFCTEKMRKSL